MILCFMVNTTNLRYFYYAAFKKKYFLNINSTGLGSPDCYKFGESLVICGGRGNFA